MGSGSAKSEPNVVPLCDILLVLLIIFMVVTPMIQKGANVKLPEAANTQDQPEPGQLISVDVKATGEIYLENKLLEDGLNSLPSAIETLMEENQQTESKVLLKADINLEYGKLVDVMNAIREARIEVVGLVTEKLASSE
ncbi:MAG TPA: biopolymer transporter ExbD [Candidatus Aminicenantes bacterium]|nr:biopolymer transporter ExbD [Candidatus Aminicenantes bacterium]